MLTPVQAGLMAEVTSVTLVTFFLSRVFFHVGIILLLIIVSAVHAVRSDLRVDLLFDLLSS